MNNSSTNKGTNKMTVSDNKLSKTLEENFHLKSSTSGVPLIVGLGRSEDDENRNKRKGDTIVARIGNIYNLIKILPSYYTKIRILIFLFLVFNLSFSWILLSMISPMKNNFYCFDSFSQEFKICEEHEFCDSSFSGVKYMVFSDDSNITNIDVLKELDAINDKYLKFFLRDNSYYSLKNAKMDKYKEIDLFHTIVIGISQREKFNFFTSFQVICNRELILIQIGFFCFFSLVLGNLLMGYLADVFGRKKVLIFSGVLKFIGCLIIFLMTNYILNSGDPPNYYSDNSSMILNYTDDIKIQNFINTFNLDSLNYQDVNNQYKKDYNENIQLLINSQIINNNFSKYKIVIYLAFMVTFITVSSTSNICLAYILENSTNDTEIFYNYRHMCYSLPISYLFHFILLQTLENFHTPFLILASINLIVVIVFSFIAFESPRYHYEFCEYREITKFFDDIIGSELNAKLFKNKDMPTYKKEIEKQYTNSGDFCKILFNNIIFFGTNEKIKKYRDMVQFNRLREVKKEELIKNPYLLFLLIRNDKHIKRNLLIIISLTAIVGLIFYFTLLKFTSNLMLSRNEVINNIIIDTSVFYLVIIMFISMLFFNFILKFFGFNIILFICFFFIFIFSLIYELISFGDRIPEDMNMYNYNSMLILYDSKSKTLKSLVFIITFFATGVFGLMFFYLSKLTKTLYRCTFFGLFTVILDFSCFMCIALSNYFEKNFFYVNVLSIIGFVNAYFIREDFDFTIIDDFRKIELEDEV